MKKKVLAMLLALCMVLSMLPASVFAAPARKTAQIQMESKTVTEPEALPQLPVEPDAGKYKITATVVKGSGRGEVKLSANSGREHDRIDLLVNPNDGYLAQIGGSYEYRDYEMEFYYVGRDHYTIYMPDGDVNLEISFVKAEGDSHKIIGAVNDPSLGAMTISRTSAKAGESVIVEATPAERCKLVNLYASDIHGNEVQGGYLGNEDGVEVFEIVMPAEELLIGAEFEPYVQHKITWGVYPTGAGTIELSQDMAYPGEIITVTYHATPGYYLQTRTCTADHWERIGNEVYSFVMPDQDVVVTGEYRTHFSYATVEVENNGLGGTATLSSNGGIIGSKMTLTCIPDEGYRVARIIGMEYLTDNGDNTYTLTMPGGVDVHLKVLFLRENNPFLDINETQFFYDSVLWAYENGITGGVDATHFGPAGVCNRAQVVTFLWAAAGSPAPTLAENPFVDIPDQSWYTDAVLWAYENGITAGADDTHFNPGGVCNRAQVVTFLYKAHGSAEPTLTENPFSDVPDGSWYAAPVLWAFENGITGGTDATHFNPGGQCLRAFAVTFLHKADQLPDVYTVRAEFDETMGTVTLSHTRAAAGTLITATINPAEGYELINVHCVNDTGITIVSDTECVFVMPEHEETFVAVFAPIPTEPAEPDPAAYPVSARFDETMGTVTLSHTEAQPGEIVTATVIPAEGYELINVHCVNDSGIGMYSDTEYYFIMPEHEEIFAAVFAPVS